MSEFACVLDAEGIRDKPEKRAKYVKDKTRRQWMMELPEEADRQAVLDLYDRFRAYLRQYGYIGLDQVIADYSQHLDSFKWDIVRSRMGYDVMFVDELHLFNRQERMIFHLLTRNATQQPVVIMAYDAKQSPRDTFVGIVAAGSDKKSFWKETKLGEMEKFEFCEVFRYSPQILNLLRSIDQQFPAVDLDEDWPAYSGFTKLPDGPEPVAVEVKDKLAMYNLVFPRAGDCAKKGGKGRKVAILCGEYDLFEEYLAAGNFKHSFIPITSREDLSRLSFAGKKYVVSMPEFVAGLQFDTVFFIDANDFAVPQHSSLGVVRRFISQLYLGASRAERQLEIYASMQRGGLSRYLKPALAQKTLASKT